MNNFPTIKQETQPILGKSNSLINITNKILTRRSTAFAKDFQYRPFIADGCFYPFSHSTIISGGKYFVSKIREWTTMSPGLQHPEIINIWDIQTGECLKTHVMPYYYQQFGDPHLILSMKYMPDGRFIMCRNNNNNNDIEVLDIQSGECIKTLKGHSDHVCSLKFSQDGKLIISSGNDGSIKIWETHSGICINTLHEEVNKDVSLQTMDSRFIIISKDYGKCLSVWNIQSGECINTFTRSSTHKAIISGAITAVGGFIAIGHGNREYGNDAGGVMLYDLESGEYIKSFPSGFSTWSSIGESVESVQFTPDGKFIICENNNNYIKVWDVQSGEHVRTIGQIHKIHLIAFMPDGKLILAGNKTYDGTIGLWDIQSGECIKTLEGHSDRVESVALTQNGKFIISGSYDNTIKVWDFETGQEIYTSYFFEDNTFVSISPDGYFNADDKAIDQYLRVNDSTIGCRKLTAEEITYFRRKKFLRL